LTNIKMSPKKKFQGTMKERKKIFVYERNFIEN